jgi:dTDP-4-amino-4,6-dideoxygalactose transaminase
MGQSLQAIQAVYSNQEQLFKMINQSPKIWLSPPHMGGAEFAMVKDAFDSNWIAPLGPYVDGFEGDLSAFLGKFSPVSAVALSSGTSALHLALILLGVERGDEVICQSMTFSASANPIAYQGATPVFVDSEMESWNMSPYWLEKAIVDRLAKGKKVKAIIPVHLYGMAARMESIMGLSRKYNIPVVEDAAEGLGASYQGRPLGSWGDLAILSFNGNKIITTSGGGALVSAKADWIKKARHLATQARDPAPHYQHSEIGYNYRMSNISAAIGRGQMQVLVDRVHKRREQFGFYTSLFHDIPGITFQPELSDSYGNRWLTAVLLDPRQTPGGIGREDLRKTLETANIESRPLWKPMHLQPVFEGCPYYGEKTSESLFDMGLCLPSGSNIQPDERERIMETCLTTFGLAPKSVFIDTVSTT